MKISIVAYGFLLTISAFAAEKQLPENQKWDGKFFHKYTKQSLPLAKEVLDTYSLQDYSRVLDIGCGPGALTAYIARRINQQNGVVTGIDPNESMITFAKEHYAKRENLLFFKLDLPIIQNACDFIFSCNMFHLLTPEKQVAALKQMALICKREKVVPLLIIMAAKTEQPQALAKAYAATLQMKRWQRLRTIELDHYFSPHDPETIKEIFKDTVWELKKTELIDEYIKFKSTKRLKKFITSWMGGFEFVALMPQVEQKQLIKDLVKNYKKEVPVADDGSIEWRSARLIVHAQKPKKA